MKNLIKKIDSTKIDINLKHFKLDFVSIKELTELILTKYSDENNYTIIDIKEFNDRQKLILDMFVNQYIYLNPSISKFSIYYEYLKPKINPMIYSTIFRGFYVASKILSQSNFDNISKYHNILQMGVLPTFIESLYRLNPNIELFNFIKIKSVKKNHTEQSFYNQMIDKLKNICPNFKQVDNIDFNNITNMKNKYDLIIFDIYKNLYPLENIQLLENINMRYFNSIIHSKYILQQIIFAFNNLNMNGDLIILFPGSNHLIYQQMITLLSSMFDQINLLNADIDFSWRYFVVCKSFKPNNQLINSLNNINLNLDNDNILLNIFDENTKILDIEFLKYLKNKFETIKNNISSIEPIITNFQLISKIYNETYYFQLANTDKWLKTIFDLNTINPKLDQLNTNYKKKLILKFEKISKDKYNLQYLKNIKINLIGRPVKDIEWNEIIQINKFINIGNIILNDYHKTNIKQKNDLTINLINPTNSKLVNILSDQIKNNKSNPNIIIGSETDIKDINTICKHLEIGDIIYIDWLYYKGLKEIQHFFDKLTNNLIIKFDLYKITPLLLSFINIFCHLYEESFIKIINQFEYYFQFNNIKSITGLEQGIDTGLGFAKSKLLKEQESRLGLGFAKSKLPKELLFDLYESINELDDNIQLLAFDSDFLLDINQILNKLFIIELINKLRYRYQNQNPDIITTHKFIKRIRKKIVF